MRIIYYSILYYIFERNPENKGLEMYEKLLDFVYQNDIGLKTRKLTISDEESKIYFTKFFYSLFRSKCKRKVIVDELSTLPQMDTLITHLMKKMTGEEDLILEINADELSRAIKK